jgi:hydroxymethylbilane synthase
LRKLDEGQFDAIVLAEAGLQRLGLAERITQVLPFESMMPAVGQGALAIECRTDDAATRTSIAPLDDVSTHAAVFAERSLLARLRGGCMAPIGAWGRIDGSELHLSAVVLNAHGTRRVAAQDFAKNVDLSDAEQLGVRVADALLAQGAAEMIAATRDEPESH